MKLKEFKAYDTQKNIYTNFMIIDNMLKFMDKITGVWFKDDKQERFRLLQYTGIKDKKGRKIYEGDILHWKDESSKSDGTLEDTVIIYWNDEFLAWMVRGKNWSEDTEDQYLFEYNQEEIEVIGSIYKEV